MLTTKTQEETENLLQGLSPEVKRINVLRANGSKKWIDPVDIEDTDLLVLKPDGTSPKVMFTEPGRPSNPKPLTAQVGNNITAKTHTIGRDSVVKIVSADPESPAVLDSVIQGLAEESASLKWERLQAEARGDDTSQYSVRRGRLLTSIGDQWLKRRDVSSSRVVDLESPAFKALFLHMVDTFRGAMQDAGMRQEMSDRVVAKFGAKMGPEWEKSARDVMQSGANKGTP